MPSPVAIPNTVAGGPGVQIIRGLGVESLEDTPELRWPLSIATFDRIRRVGKGSTVRRAVMLPLQRAFRLATLDGDGVPDPVVAHVKAQLGLDVVGDGRRRRRGVGIEWPRFIREALTHLDFGHAYLEQWAEAGPAPADIPGLPSTVAHLRALSFRNPRSIAGFDVDPQTGGLDGIRQWVTRGTPPRSEAVPIPIGQLVAFVNEQEGADWTGLSMWRAGFPHYVIIDGLMRLGPMVAERNGMGVPVVEYDAGGNLATALDIARRARAGEEAGVAYESGYRLTFRGVEGTLKDELPLLKWHSEELAKTALAMFIDLGHDNGARSLGETFADTFLLGLDSVAEYMAGVITEHVIRDLVEWTFGEGAPYPTLRPASLAEQPALSAEALKSLVEAGLITPDEPLETWVRGRNAMPDKPAEDPNAAASSSGARFTEADLGAGTILVNEHRARLGLGPHPDPAIGAMSVAEAQLAVAAAAAGTPPPAGAAQRQLAALTDDELKARILALHSRLNGG